MRLTNGTRRDAIRLHVGLCLTDDARAAAHYGETLTTVEIDLDSLTVERVAAYDHESNVAAGDADCGIYAALGYDVIVYTDETERSYQHTTWRIVSARGLAAVRVVGA